MQEVLPGVEQLEQMSEKNGKSIQLSILKSRPFPASSSTYIQRNCKMRIISTMKNVNINGPINDFKTKVSTFFTYLIAFEVQNYLIFFGNSATLQMFRILKGLRIICSLDFFAYFILSREKSNH